VIGGVASTVLTKISRSTEPSPNSLGGSSVRERPPGSSINDALECGIGVFQKLKFKLRKTVRFPQTFIAECTIAITGTALRRQDELRFALGTIEGVSQLRMTRNPKQLVCLLLPDFDARENNYGTPLPLPALASDRRPQSG
jgi:hypothetical protein